MAIRREQFQLQLDRLIDVFGEKHFGEQRAHMVWEVVSGLEYPDVISIVDQFIRSAKHSPLPADFSAAAQGFKNSKHALGDMLSQEQALCMLCGDSGFCEVVRLEPHEEWAKFARGSAPCSCHLGASLVRIARNLGRRSVEFNSNFGPHWESSYKIVPAYQSRVGVAPKGEP